MEKPAKDVPSANFPWEPEPSARYAVKNPSQYSEFELKYPPDSIGGEAVDTGRVWTLYRDRAKERDEDQLGRWNRNIDVLLVYSGIFSAVAAAFVVEGRKALLPDSSALLAQTFIAAQLRSSNISSLDDDVSGFKVPVAALWYNGLWVTSLALSLIAALLAITAKQWLEEYASSMRLPRTSLMQWALRHFVCSKGLQVWGMDAFIATLPVLLHLSVLAFLAGLVVFFAEANNAIAFVVLSAVVVALAFWLTSTLLPLWYGACPTVTPVVHHLRRALRFVQKRRNPDWVSAWSLRRLVPSQARFRAKVLVSMIRHLPNTVEVNVALDAIGGLGGLAQSHVKKVKLIKDPRLLDRYRALQIAGQSADSADIGRFLRTLLLLDTPLFEEQEQYRRGYFRVLRQWSTIRTNDVSFIALWLLAEAGEIDLEWLVEDVAEWYMSLPSVAPVVNARPCHPSTLDLLCRSIVGNDYDRPTSLSHLQLLVALVCCEVGHFRFEPNRFSFANGPTKKLFNAIQSVFESCSIQGGVMNAFPKLESDSEDSDIDTKLWLLQFLRFFIDGFEMPKTPSFVAMVQHAYGSVLASNGKRRLVVPAVVLAHMVGFVNSPHFAQHVWSSWDLDRIAFLLCRVIPRCTTDTRMMWSQLLHTAVSHIVDSCVVAERTRASFAAPRDSQQSVDLATARKEVLRRCAQTDSLQCGELATAIGKNYTSTNHLRSDSRVRMLVPTAEGLPPLWASLRGALSADNLAPLARELCIVLCTLKRRGEDVIVEIGTLLADGMDIALLQTSRGHWYHIMRHAKEIAPEWWQQFSDRVLAEKESSSTSGDDRKMVRRIKRLKDARPCRDCPGGLGELSLSACGEVGKAIRENYTSLKDLRSNSRVNTLVPGAGGQPPVWLSLRGSPSIDRAEHLAPLVHALSIILYTLDRQREDMTAELSVLMADGMDVALLQTSHGYCYHIMRHAKKVAPEWWSQLSSRICPDKDLGNSSSSSAPLSLIQYRIKCLERPSWGWCDLCPDWHSLRFEPRPQPDPIQAPIHTTTPYLDSLSSTVARPHDRTDIIPQLLEVVGRLPGTVPEVTSQPSEVGEETQSTSRSSSPDTQSQATDLPAPRELTSPPTAVDSSAAPVPVTHDLRQQTGLFARVARVFSKPASQPSDADHTDQIV